LTLKTRVTRWSILLEDLQGTNPPFQFRHIFYSSLLSKCHHFLYNADLPQV
jgi:hypothetical protein